MKNRTCFAIHDYVQESQMQISLFSKYSANPISNLSLLFGKENLAAFFKIKAFMRFPSVAYSMIAKFNLYAQESTCQWGHLSL